LTGALIVYSDGACRGNPGPSGAGWVLAHPDGSIVGRGNLFLGHRTNNEAEYLAAAMGLQAAADIGCKDVTLRADSELMIRQLTGVYKVRNARIIPLFKELKKLADKFPTFKAEHVRREFNVEADAEANLAIDNAR
jgi:ribonuclease HI